MQGISPDDPVSELLKEFEYLKTERANWESQWQNIADLMLPRRNDFTASHTSGIERRSKIFDSTPPRSVTRFAAGLHNIMTPAAAPWFVLKPLFRPLEKERSVQLWLEEIQRLVQEEFGKPGSNFHPAAYEYYTDLGAFGTAVMFIEDLPGRGPYFRHFPLSDCLLQTNNLGQIDTCFRSYKQTAKELVERFPADRLPEKVMKSLENGKPYDSYEIIHVVKPFHSIKPGPLLMVQKPFVSLHICKDEKMMIGINGYEEFPYVCSRWSRNALEIYGRGPGVEALADTRMLNEMEKTFLKGVQKAVAPPLMVPDDGFLAPIRTTPDAINYYRPGLQGNEMIFQMPTVGRIEYAEAKMGQVREAIEKAFFLDLLELPGPVASDGDVLRFTATEIAMRQRDRLIVLGPIVARQEAEFLGPLLDRTMKVMTRMGLLPPPPQEFGNIDFKIEYVNPVSVSMRSVELNAVSQLIQFVMPLAQIDPSVLGRLNTSRITELGAEILRAPASSIYTEEEAAAIAQQRQQEEQMMMQADMANAQADVEQKQASAEASRAKAEETRAAA